MSLEKDKKTEYEKLCGKLRKDLIELLHAIGSGHPGGSLSATEIIVALYCYAMKNGQDHFVLSKGHAVPMQYLILSELGVIPKEELKSLRQIDSRLQGHPCAHKTPGIELSAGPLGLGISGAVGIALAQKIKNNAGYTYVLLGDGELQEGVVWEACMAASKYKLDNLIAIVDNNGVQLDGALEQIMPMGEIADKFSAFGWEPISCNGHDIAEICNAIDTLKESEGKPKVVLAHTVKGKGVSFMEGKNIWHGKLIGDEDYRRAMAELEAAYAK